jgi:hypothetical protein
MPLDERRESIMAAAMRVTGAWVQLLTDWLDRENLPAPALRTVLDSRSPADLVPLPLWRDLLQQAVALRPDRVAPGLSIGAMVQPRHVGMLGYLILTCRTLGEAMQAYQRYETLFYGQDMVEVLGLGDQMQVRWSGEDSTGELADTVAIAALITFLRRLVDDPPSPAVGDSLSGLRSLLRLPGVVCPVPHLRQFPDPLSRHAPAAQ